MRSNGPLPPSGSVNPRKLFKKCNQTETNAYLGHLLKLWNAELVTMSCLLDFEV